MSDAILDVLVAEDEPAARRGIVRLLQELPGVRLVAAVGDGRSALEVLRQQRIDVALLDVEMPELDGLSVALECEPDRRPAVVFVTAHDRYALEAFEAHAVDYVLKPIDPERFERALGRARAFRLGARPEPDARGLSGLLDEVGSRTKSPARIAARSGGRVQFVPVAALAWMEAADNYVRLHVGGRVILHREPLARLVQRLDPRAFVRIHRSTAVRLDEIAELVSEARGDARVVLRDGTILAVSRRYREGLERALEV